LGALGVGRHVDEADVACVAFRQGGNRAAARVLGERARLLEREFREHGLHAPVEVRLRAHDHWLPYDVQASIG
jgi:hypothetical protein